jgi:hypothetical protein
VAVRYTPTVVSAAESRRAALGILALTVPLPLQWQSLGHGPLGTVRWFHIGGILMVLIGRPGRVQLRIILDRLRPLPAASVLVTTSVIIAALAWHGNWIAPLQVFVYIALGIVGGACLLSAFASQSGLRLLALSGPLTLLMFAVMFAQSVQRAGLNAARTFQQALLQGDTKALEFGLYRAAFRTTDPSARDNLRHEIVAALLVATYLSLAASAYAERFKLINIVSAITVFGLVSVSLSRSVMIAMVIPMVLAAAKILSRARLPALGFLGLVMGLLASPYLVAKLGPLLAARFQDTGSYNGRVTNLISIPGSEALHRMVFGGKTLDASTHMWVVDSFMNGSWLAGLGAVAAVLAMVRLAIEAARLYFRVGGLFYWALVAAVTLTIMRAFTTGGGNIYEGEWFALGLVAACLHIVRDRPVTDGPPRFHELTRSFAAGAAPPEFSATRRKAPSPPPVTVAS